MTLLKRNWRLFACAALLAGALPAAGFAADSKPSMEANVSRWGSDYRRFTLDKGGAEACAEACAGDAKCQAWSYVKPSTSNASPVCRLKSSVPSAAPDPCCVSGVVSGSSLSAALGDISADKKSQMALSATKPAATGVTGSIGKKKKPSNVAVKTNPSGEILQMPAEAETPDALGTIAVPLDMPVPVSSD